MVSIKGNSVDIKNNHGLPSIYHITDVRKVTMAEKIEESLPDFKKIWKERETA